MKRDSWKYKRRMSKSVMLNEMKIPVQCNEKFLCLQRYGRNRLKRETLYMALISGFNYRHEKIIRHETATEHLDYDPSEGQDWNWGDYE